MREKARWLCVVLALTMVLQTAGCGGKTPASKEPGLSGLATEETVASSSAAEEKGSEELSALQAETSEAGGNQTEKTAKITNHGEKITDFYDMVNAQWMQEEIKKDSAFSGYFAQNERQMMDRIEKLLNEANLEEMDPSEDFYKVVTFYRQLTDDEARKSFDNKKIKKYLDRIDSAKSLKELYQLYADPDYLGCFHIFGFHMMGDVYESGTILIMPKTAIGGYYDINVTNSAGLQKMLTLVGYSGKRAEEIVKNAHEVDNYVLAVGGVKAWSDKIDYLTEENLSAEGNPFPVIRIFNDLHFLDDHQVVKASQNILPFWEKLYVPENLQKIKDHMILSALNEFSVCGSAELFDTFSKTVYLSDSSLGTSKRDMLLNYICGCAGDIIADQYCKTYLDEEIIPNAEEWGKKIRSEMKKVIEETDWLTIDGESYLKDKVLYLKTSYGRNLLPFSLEEVTLTKDPLENAICISKASWEFAKDHMWNLKKHRSTRQSMEQLNAYYDGTVNGFVVCDGLLSTDFFRPDAPYEEQLAGIGICLAHELGHAFDPNFIDIDYEGYGYYDWMAEREDKAYREMIEKIIAFYDGRKVDSVKSLNGRDICGETFADLTAMHVCLRLLEKKEDADYDLFFRSYARTYASRSNVFQLLGMDAGKYLPPRERVNLIVGMFDEFYETYDIDENSPFFIPKEERVKGF